MGSSMPLKRSGKLVGNGSARKIVLGFQPAYVKLINVTDRISHEKMALMEAKKALKVIADGTATYVDSVTLDADGFTLEAGAYVSAKEYHYLAEESKNEL